MLCTGTLTLGGKTYTTTVNVTLSEQPSASYVTIQGAQVEVDTEDESWTYTTTFSGADHTYAYNAETGVVNEITGQAAVVYAIENTDQRTVTLEDGSTPDASTEYTVSYTDSEGSTQTFTTVGSAIAQYLSDNNIDATELTLSASLDTLEVESANKAGTGISFLTSGATGTTAAIVDDSAELDGVTFTFTADGATYVSVSAGTRTISKVTQSENGLSFTLDGDPNATLAHKDGDTWIIDDASVTNVTNSSDSPVEVQFADGDSGTLAANDSYDSANNSLSGGGKSVIKNEDGYATGNGLVTGVSDDGSVSYNEDGNLVIEGANGDTAVNGTSLPVSGDDNFNAVLDTTGNAPDTYSAVSDGATVDLSDGDAVIETDANSADSVKLTGDGKATVDGTAIEVSGDPDGITVVGDAQDNVTGIEGLSNGATIKTTPEVPVSTDSFSDSLAAEVNDTAATLTGSDEDGVTFSGNEVSGIADAVTVASDDAINAVPEEGAESIGLADGFNGSVAGSQAAVSGTSATANVADGELSGLSDITPGEGVSVSAEAGTPVSTNGEGTVNVNGTPLTVEGDEDGVTITPDADGGFQVEGLDEGAMLSSSEDVPVTVGSGDNTVAGTLGAESSVKGAAEGQTPSTYDVSDKTADENMEALGINPNNLTAVEPGGEQDLSDMTEPVLYRDDTDEDASVTLPAEGGSYAQIDKDASGSKQLTAGDGGDNLVNLSPEAKVTMTGGAGDDYIKTAGSSDVVDVSAGGKDTVDVSAGGSVVGYDPMSEDAPVLVIGDEQTQADLLSALESGTPELKDDAIGSGIKLDEGREDGNTFARLQTKDGESNLYGWTGEDGGEISSADLGEAAVLLGNTSGNHAASTIDGSASSYADTLVAGANDLAVAGNGDTVELVDNQSVSGGGEAAGVDTDNTSKTVNINGFKGGFGRDANWFRGTGFDGFKFANGIMSLVKGAATYLLSGSAAAGYIEKFEDETDSDVTVTAARPDATDPGNGLLEFRTVNGTSTVNNVAIAEDKSYYVADGDEASLLSFMGEGTSSSISPANGTTVNFSDVEGDVAVDMGGNFLNDKYEFQNIEKIVGGSGNNTLIGDNGRHALQAGSGLSSIYGGSSADSLYSYDGTDGSKEATFFYTAGSGADSIKSFDWGSGEDNDKVNFSNTYLEGASFDANGNLKVTLEGGDDVLTIENAKNQKIKAVANATGYDGVVEFGDDLTYDSEVNMYGNTGETNNKLTINDSNANGENVAVYMNAKNEWGQAYDGNFYYNVNQVDASALSSNASLAGGDYEDDSIAGGAGSNSLWGGLGGADTLVGGTGTNTFFYLLGDGDDVITNAKSGDTIELWNMSLSDINLEETYNNSSTSAISVKFNNGDTLTINPAAGNGLGNVGFKINGETWKINSDKTWRNRGDDTTES